MSRIKYATIFELNIQTSRSEHCVDQDQTEQFDQGLHCLSFYQYFKDLVNFYVIRSAE